MLNQVLNNTSTPKPQLFLTKSRTQRGGGGASRPQNTPATPGYVSNIHVYKSFIS